MTFLDTTLLDVHYAVRVLRKSPTFTLTVVLTLALGIGANTAMFGVVRGVLLKPLGYRDSERLVRISVDDVHKTERDAAFTVLRVEQLRASAKSLSGVGAYLKFKEDMALSGTGGPVAVKGARVSANFLDVLGVQPLAGRGFLPEEDAGSGPAVMMISSGLWERRFHNDPLILGKTVDLNSTPYTLVGVIPEGFAFPFVGTDVWVTRPSEWSAIPSRFWSFVATVNGFARLSPGVSVQQAQAEMDVLNRQYVNAHPGRLDAKAGLVMHATPLREQLTANLRPTLWMLFGAVALVLFIACANVAGLLLARAQSRSREFAIRDAIGAGRGRIVQQLLVESMLLALAGCMAGVVAATVILREVRNVGALALPGVAGIRLDGTVLTFAVALSVVTAVVFGLVPALKASHQNLTTELREPGAGRTSTPKHRMAGFNGRGLLVVGQISFSICLLIGAGLLMKSFARLRSVDPGFETENIVTMKVALAPSRYNTPEKRAAFFRELAVRAGGLTGVRHAGLVMSLPTTADWLGTNVQVEGQPIVDGTLQPTARLQSVTPAYFSAMSISLRRGRGFTERDDRLKEQSAVIINESFARRFWPSYPAGINPIGRHLREGIDHTDWLPIVGIVADVHESELSDNSGPEFYVLPVIHAPQTAYLAVNAASQPSSLVSAIRREVLAIDSSQPVSDIRTMDDVLDSTLGQRRLTVVVLGSFAGVALLLAILGLYGVVAYSVSQRTQEVGIRTALGAQAIDVLRLVLRQGLTLALCGVVIGTVAALALTRVMESFLFQVRATDPMTFAGVDALFVLVALGAALVPALRALKIDPMTALRTE